jgi:hypothetical protein
LLQSCLILVGNLEFTSTNFSQGVGYFWGYLRESVCSKSLANRRLLRECESFRQLHTREHTARNDARSTSTSPPTSSAITPSDSTHCSNVFRQRERNAAYTQACGIRASSAAPAKALVRADVTVASAPSWQSWSIERVYHRQRNWICAAHPFGTFFDLEALSKTENDKAYQSNYEQDTDQSVKRHGSILTKVAPAPRTAPNGHQSKSGRRGPRWVIFDRVGLDSRAYRFTVN